MGERIRNAGAVAWACVGIAAVVALLGFLAYVVRVIWPPLILAGAIVFLLNPIVSRIQRRGLPRPAAAGLAYLGVVLIAVVVGLSVAPLATHQYDDLADRWPDLQEDLRDTVNDWSRKSEEGDWFIKIPTYEELEDQFRGDEKADKNNDGRIDAEERRERFTHQLDTARELALRVFHVGQLGVAFVVGVMSSIGLLIIDLPFWLIIGMVAGVFNMIPLIGPWVGAVPGIVIAITTGGGIGKAVAVAVVMAIVQQIDNHFISPMVMQRAVKLHPAVVMLALLAGGTLLGFFGLLLAVPTVAVLKIVCGHLWHRFVLGEPLDEVESRWEAEEDHPGVGPVEDLA
jgi:predicted PurR-regulated permease PerM